MPSRILLISTNRCEFPYPVFPLGLAMVDTALRREGHETRWLDCQTGAQTLDAVLEGFEPDVVGLSLRNIDDVVFRRKETYFGALLELGAALRARTRARLVLGGSGFSIFPERLLELSGADFGILGEGEAALVELVRALEQGADPTGIEGLVHRTEGRVLVNGRRPQGWPGNGDIPERPAELVRYYLESSCMLNVQTQRGCPFECCYCTYPLLEGRVQRRRAPESVAEEFAQLEAAGARYVFVVDSVFNSSPSHVHLVCDALLRRGTRLSWGCFLRPQGLDAGQMRLMARAGLKHIEFGTDSLCDSVLAAYGKRFTFADVQQSSALARAENVDFCHFLICGGPGETMETLEATYRASEQLPGAVILALPGMRVYPGTPLFDAARRRGDCPGTGDLLEPHFYFSPDLEPDQVVNRLQEFSRRSPQWIVNEPTPDYYAFAAKLRRRGVVGPLWSYLAMVQRVLGR